MNRTLAHYSDVTVVPDSLRLALLLDYHNWTSPVENRMDDVGSNSGFRAWGRAYDEMVIVASEILSE